MEGTAAVLDADTAVAAPEITPSPDDAGSVQDTSPETEGTQEAPDSEDHEEETPKSFTQAEVDQALKEQAAKMSESHRRLEENARKEAETAVKRSEFDKRSQAAMYTRTQYANQTLAELMQAAHKAAEESIPLAEVWKQGSDVHKKYVALLGNLENMAFMDMYEGWSEQQDMWLEREYPEFSVPRELVTELDAATRTYPRNNVAMFEARMKVLKEAMLSDLTPKLRKQVEEEMVKADEERSKEAAVKGADSRRGSSRPTDVGRTAPGKETDPRGILHDAKSSLEAKQKAYKQLYGDDYQR